MARTRTTPLFLSLGALALLGGLVAGCGSKHRSGSGAASTTAGATSGSTAGTTSAAPTTSSTLPSGVLSALTYNVAGLPQGISQSSPRDNIPQISPKLNTYPLVVVQEDFWYHTQLARDAQHPFQSLPLTGYTTLVGDGLNRFSQTSFYDFTRVKWRVMHGIIGGANDQLSSKGFSVARHVLAPGVEVDVYNVHADAGGGSGDIRARVDNFAQLAQFMAVYSAGKAVLVGGDTNLSGNRADDMQTLADFLGTTGLADAARTLGNGSLPEVLDRWLFKSSADVELVPVGWRFGDEFKDAQGQPLSDHEAVHVDFAWRRLR